MPTVDLGQIAALYPGTTPPSNIKMLWYDDNTGEKILKFYDLETAAWKRFDGVGVYLPLSGGSLTNFLTLHAAPTSDLHAATKKYVDDAVSGANSLAGVLAIGNETGGNPLVVTAGDSIQFLQGEGGTLTPATTTGSAKTWTLPDATGTLLIGTGTNNRLARWINGSLSTGAILDNGSTSAIGTIDGTVSLNVASTLSKGIKSSVDVDSGSVTLQSIIGVATGATETYNQGGHFEGIGSTGINYGIYAVADSSTGGGEAKGGHFISKGSTSNEYGIWGEYQYIEGLLRGSGVFGKTPSVLGSTFNAGVSALLFEGGGTADITTFDSVHAALSVKTGGSSTGLRYGGYIDIDSTNTANNIGLYIKAENGDNNYALITGSGLVGIGVSQPTKQFEVSSGTGKVTLDTSSVTSAYNLDISIDDTRARFRTTASKNFDFSINGTVVETLLTTGRVAVGPHTTASSHLHVKYSGALVGMDGSIRGTMSNTSVYDTTDYNLNNSIVLENENVTSNNSSMMVFRAMDTGDTIRDSAFMGAVYHTRAAATLSADLVFGISAASVLSEGMRIKSTGDITALGSLTVGSRTVGSEKLNVDGVVSILNQEESPDATAGYGKVYPKADGQLYFMNDDGEELQLSNQGGGGGTLIGSGVANQVSFWTGASSLGGSANMTFDGNTLTVANLIVNGTTTTIDSTVTTIKDPVITIGGKDAPVSDDNKDRGVEFRYFDGSAKVGFFGFDDSTGRFTFKPDATNTGEIFSGNAGHAEFGNIYSTALQITGGASDKKFLIGDPLGNATWSTIDSLTEDASPDSVTDYLMTWDASASIHKKIKLSSIVTGGNTLLDGTKHTDTQAAAATRGALIVGKGVTTKWDILTRGTIGQVLTSDGTDLYWADNQVPIDDGAIATDTLWSSQKTNQEFTSTNQAISDLTTTVSGKEPAFTKNTGFNLNVGTTTGTVAAGDHIHPLAENAFWMGDENNEPQEVESTNMFAANDIATDIFTTSYLTSNYPDYKPGMMTENINQVGMKTIQTWMTLNKGTVEATIDTNNLTILSAANVLDISSVNTADIIKLDRSSGAAFTIDKIVGGIEGKLYYIILVGGYTATYTHTAIASLGSGSIYLAAETDFVQVGANVNPDYLQFRVVNSYNVEFSSKNY